MDHPARRGPIGLRTVAIVIAVLWALYLLVFVLTDLHSGLLNKTIWAFCNAAPVILFALPLIDRLAPRIARARPGPAITQAALAILTYAMVSYGAIVFLMALTRRSSPEGILVIFFSGQALPWQMFQGVAYGTSAVLAGLWLYERANAEGLARALEEAPETAVPASAAPPRWLVKTPDGIVAIDPTELIRIEAAGEYCHLILAAKRHLSRISIGECESRLGRQGFLRVHRSHLINSDRLIGAETAGNGRLQLVLSNGDQILTSRQGAKLVRAAAV